LTGAPYATTTGALPDAMPEAMIDAIIDATSEGCTFVVDRGGTLRLAPRRSEHVACAGGQPVLAAGELRLTVAASGALSVHTITNQSTGYCPEPECWPAVAAALVSAGIAPPAGFTHAFIFRRCEACAQINIVKEAWFVCASCDGELPLTWNLDSARRRR
jgi:hypothetical protein